MREQKRRAASKDHAIVIAVDSGCRVTELVEALERAGWEAAVIASPMAGCDGPSNVMANEESANGDLTRPEDAGGVIEDTQLFTYKDPDDGTLRILC